MAVDIDPTGTRITIPGRDGNPLPISAAAGEPTLLRISTTGGAVATIYPAVGFNLLDWRIPVGDGHVAMIHAEPDALSGGSGTRSGQPILFPFPNRIANARYSWDGRDYQLALSHLDDRHAIHGFCAKAAWTRYEASGESSVTGEFQLTRDAPTAAATWPGDLLLRVTFALTDQALRVTTNVTNVDDHPVPFGAGFHPYFAPLAAAGVDDLALRCDAASYWVLDGLIPTGQTLPVAGANDLRSGPVVGDRVLDDVLTDLPAFVPGDDGLMERARLTGGDVSLAIRCDSAYRDIVVFTPANRESLAVEPYTCPTDAIHLAQAGRSVGWRVLAPAESWTGVVEYTTTVA